MFTKIYDVHLLYTFVLEVKRVRNIFSCKVINFVSNIFHEFVAVTGGQNSTTMSLVVVHGVVVQKVRRNDYL